MDVSAPEAAGDGRETFDSARETVGQVGEFPLIDRIVAILGPTRADTIIGAGSDDTAVLRLPDGRLQLATIDTQISGVHFLIDRYSPQEIGRKVAAVNLSDIAAMGGMPTHALVSLAGPPDLTVEFALKLLDGLVRELARWGADLIGGNLARHDGLVLDMALLGETDRRRLLLRSGAQPGDAVLVTGHLGAAAAGAALLQQSENLSHVPPEHRQEVLARQRWPEPRLEAGVLLGPAGATAAIDVSDGLAADAGHICQQSDVGMRLEAARLPIATATRAVAEALGRDALALALAGGEDYELLFTAPEEKAPGLAAAVRQVTGVSVTVIGTVTSGPDRVLVDSDGRERELAGGWRHYG